MRCPDCDGEMEAGSLIGRLFLRWVTPDRGFLGSQAGPVVKWDLLRNPRLDGFRCTACRLIVARY